MNKTRLEAFSDGVIAIIITIMVLEMKVPHGSEAKDLKPESLIWFRRMFAHRIRPLTFSAACNKW